MPRLPMVFVVLHLVALWALPAHAQSTRQVSKAGDWTLYLHDGTSRICFASAAPKSSEPKVAAREVAQLFISGWPKEGIKTEISVKLGFAAKKGSDVTVAVGNQSFKLFVAGDRAFVADATQELKLLEALKKGATAVVQSVPETGGPTKDTYSLQGLSQALQGLAGGCN